MGATHGLYCVGCCWALMLLLFVGVMKLLLVALVAAFVLIEKLLPDVHIFSRAAGFVLIGAGLYVLLSP
jgi:predicted metal-binding membrane protein